jgi:hypothetical protein
MGGMARLKEKCRDMRRVTFVANLARDLRYGALMLRQEPGVQRDPGVYAATALTVACVALTATVTPPRQAAQVDPMAALP